MGLKKWDLLEIRKLVICNMVAEIIKKVKSQFKDMFFLQIMNVVIYSIAG